MASKRLICFNHPQYNGKDSPVLTCKTCCGIFVTSMKEKVAQRDLDKPHRAGSEQLDQFDDRESILDEQSIYTFSPSSI
jgi:hypothetical protein